MPRDVHRETAPGRAWRRFQETFVGVGGAGWVVLWGAAASAASVWLSEGRSVNERVAIAFGFALLGAVVAAVLWYVALLLMAPYRQRDDARHDLALARAELVGRQERFFPDVGITAERALSHLAPSPGILGDEDKTLIGVRVRFINREAKNVVLTFSASVQVEKPFRRKDSLASAGPYANKRLPDEIEDPLTLPAENVREGALYFVFDHSTDFVFGKDISKEDVLDQLGQIQITATDLLSELSKTVEVEGPIWR
jgi:hypothetical protein